MVRPMRKTRAPTQSQRAIGHIAALQSIATMFVMHAMVGRSTLQFKMPRLDAYVQDASPGRLLFNQPTRGLYAHTRLGYSRVLTRCPASSHGTE